MAKTGNRGSNHMPLGRNALLAMMYLSRLPWLHVEIVRVGGLQAFCIVKYADTIFHLCGTKGGLMREVKGALGK